MSSELIRRWARTEPVRDGIAGLVPVHVIAEAAPAKTLTVWSPVATLTTPFGESRLELWRAVMFLVPGVGVSVVGVPENAAVIPPATAATVTTAGSDVRVTEYAPSAVVGPTSIVSSVTKCWPARAVAGQERVA